MVPSLCFSIISVHLVDIDVFAKFYGIPSLPFKILKNQNIADRQTNPTDKQMYIIIGICWVFVGTSSRQRTYVTSRDFNDRVHVLFLEILCDSVKTLFDISVNTGQICMKFEADTPQKLLKYAHLTKFSDKHLI